MDVKYLKRTAVGFLSILLVVAVFVYVIYHMTGGFASEISTTPALYAEYLDKDDARGCIFRYETPVSSKYSGTVNYNLSDGEKVKQGELAATVYESGGDEHITRRMVEIDREIELLARSNISDNIAISGTNGVDEEIAGYLAAVREAKRTGDLDLLERVSDELRVALNRRELIVGSRTDYNAEIAELREQRKQLAAQLSGKNEPVYASESGYFYYKCDGYENIFDPAELAELTPDRFDYLLSCPPETVSGIGKSVSVQKWYMALELDRTELGKYAEGESYSVAFRDYADMRIKMKLERVCAEADRGVLVFSTNSMPDGFDFERFQDVSIITGEHDALRFPASALRLNEGVEGVYVLYGNTVFFKRADILGRDGGYAYIRRPDRDTEDAEDGAAEDPNAPQWQKVSLYDEIIIAGTGLYHGMIVN